MIVVRITGGLGNQMFQFAFARTVQAQGKNVVIQWHGHRTKSQHNGWELDQTFIAPLSEKIKVANHTLLLNCTAWAMRKTIRRRGPSDGGYNPKFLNATSGYLDGYWQSEKYFAALANTIRSDFRFKPLAGDKNSHLQKRIAAEPCVSVHVRRGDYVTHPGLGNICNAEYYEKALEKLDLEQPGSTPVVFSDDIPHCRKMFSGRNTVFVDWNQGPSSWMDMALMSQCRHHIIANSSFSWWGAWLGEHREGLTLAPKHWYAETHVTTNPDIFPKNWINII